MSEIFREKNGCLSGDFIHVEGRKFEYLEILKDTEYNKTSYQLHFYDWDKKYITSATLTKNQRRRYYRSFGTNLVKARMPNNQPVIHGKKDPWGYNNYGVPGQCTSWLRNVLLGRLPFDLDKCQVA